MYMNCICLKSFYVAKPSLEQPQSLMSGHVLAMDRVCFRHAAYDKLAKWKFKIHGGIDGASHFVLWCVVATDKLATTIFKGYKAAVDVYGHPIRIRSDYATEHSLVRQDQERARPDVIKPFLTGSSVHNQVNPEALKPFHPVSAHNS
jgi:hypothetical protein